MAETPDCVPVPIRRAFDLLYTAARRAPLSADEHDAVKHAVAQVNEALVAAYPSQDTPSGVPVETRA